jgi:hypothetical protein
MIFSILASSAVCSRYRGLYVSGNEASLSLLDCRPVDAVTSEGNDCFSAPIPGRMCHPTVGVHGAMRSRPEAHRRCTEQGSISVSFSLPCSPYPKAGISIHRCRTPSGLLYISVDMVVKGYCQDKAIRDVSFPAGLIRHGLGALDVPDNLTES